MVDTTYIELNKQPFNDLLLSNKKKTVDCSTGEVSITGYFKNIRISVNSQYIWLMGSLSEYYYGNNIYSLNRQSLKKAIRKLGKELGLDLNKGIVRRLDLARTFKVKHPVKHYFQFFTDSPYYKDRFIDQNSLYYKNGNRLINIYDKIKKLKSKGIEVPVEFQNDNWMRLETRWKSKHLKTIMKEFNKNHLYVSDLSDIDIYSMLIKKWHEEYHRITKRNTIGFNLSKMKKPSDFVKYLILKGLESIGGMNGFNEMIERSRAIYDSPYKSFFSKVKTLVRKLSQNTLHTHQGDEILELNARVDECLLDQINNL